MKKLGCFLGFCILVLCLAACGQVMQPQSPKFESESAMLTFLNGMWVTENSENKEYFVFQGDDAHNITDEDLADSFDELLDDTLKKQGIPGLVELDYQTALTTLGDKKLLRHKCFVQIDPAQGTVTFKQGKPNEKSIIVENDAVYVKYKERNEQEKITKVSETTDFSGETFVKIFDNIKKNYMIPTSKYWMDPLEYAGILEENVMKGYWTKVITRDETVQYSLDLPNRTGTFIANKESVFCSDTLTISTYFGEKKMRYRIDYTPYAASGSNFAMMDTTSLDINALIQHVIIVTQNFPYAPDFQQLYNALMNGYADVNGSKRDATKTIGGITYKLIMNTDENWGQIFVYVPAEFKLSEIP